MNIIPAIDLRQGRVVQLVGGDPDQQAVTAPVPPQEQARLWREAGATRLHVVDLDAALGGPSQWVELSRILAQGLPVQFGGGVRSMLQVQKLLDLGAERVIIGTQGIRNPDWLTELANLFPGRIVLAVDGTGLEILIEGWQEEAHQNVLQVLASVADVPLAGVLYTNVSKEGRMEGPDLEVLAAVRGASQHHLVASGGIGKEADLDAIGELGVDAVVLGMSIYTGTLDLAKAVQKHEVAT